MEEDFPLTRRRLVVEEGGPDGCRLIFTAVKPYRTVAEAQSDLRLRGAEFGPDDVIDLEAARDPGPWLLVRRLQGPPVPPEVPDAPHIVGG